MKKNFLAAVLLMVVAFGCKKNELSLSASANTTQLLINTDAAALSQRVQTSESGVLTLHSGITNGRLTGDSVSSNPYPMELIASVVPPVYQNSTLRATHVEINGNYAYVSYNTEGSVYLGGIDIFNIAVAGQPQLISSVIIPFTDISAIAYYNNRLYLAGASDITQTTGIISPAMIGWLELTNGIPTGKFQFSHFAGEVGTSVTVSDNKIFGTTGSDGSFLSLDPSTLQQQASIQLQDLRAVAATNDRIALLNGSTGVNIYNKSTYGLTRSIAVGADIAEAKRTMDFNNNYLLIAGGKKGILYYNTDNGQKAGEVKLPSTLPAGVSAEDVVTNAVSNNNGLFFAANGAAGTYVCKENEDHTLQLVGAIGLSGSANYVKSKDNYLFVACGKEGLKIIKFTQPVSNNACSGLPAYTGSADLNVNGNDNLQYSGSVALQNVMVNAALYYCGSMTIAENLTINGNGVMELHGALSVGQNTSKTLTINNKAVLKVEGNLVIYGDLKLNTGATLQFLGTNSTITVYGKVTKGDKVTISGNYVDVSNKL